MKIALLQQHRHRNLLLQCKNKNKTHIHVRVRTQTAPANGVKSLQTMSQPVGNRTALAGSLKYLSSLNHLLIKTFAHPRCSQQQQQQQHDPLPISPGSRTSETTTQNPFESTSGVDFSHHRSPHPSYRIMRHAVDQ